MDGFVTVAAQGLSTTKDKTVRKRFPTWSSIYKLMAMIVDDQTSAGHLYEDNGPTILAL